MSLPAKAIFGFIVFLSSFSQTGAFVQDDPVSDIEWYNNFFRDGIQKPVEDVLALSNRKLQIATENQDMAGRAKALKEIGLIHLTRANDYEKAMDFLIKALAIEDSLDIKNKQVFTYLGIAKVFEEVGDFEKGLQFLQQAIAINEKFKNYSILVLILNELGKTHAASGLIDEAFENYKQVLEYTDQVRQPAVEAEALFNLAHLYQLKNEYDSALNNYKKALAIRRSLSDKKNEARSLNDIGELYRVMKNYEKAFANHTVALEIRQKLGDKKGIAESYNNIGVIYYQSKNFHRAIANLLLGLQAARESQAQEEQAKSYEYLSQSYSELGDYKKALENESQFSDMNDFIQHDKNAHQLLETQNRYVINKKESEIGKLEFDRVQREMEIESQREFRNFLFILIALSVIIIVLVFYLYVTKQKTNKILQEANDKVNRQNIELQNLNATKDKFFSIISHDLKGPLNSLTSFSSLLINHTDSLSKEEIQMMATDLDKSIKNLFALLENLLEWSRSQTGNIEFKPEVFDVAAILDENINLLRPQAQGKNITLISENISEHLALAHKPSINTVVRNLISNAIKFTPEGGRITMALKRNNKEVIVSITDTGVGMPAEVLEKLFRIDTKHSTKGTANEKGTGLGLILCKEFVEKNNGRIWVTSKPEFGSTFYFTLPLVS